MGKVKKGEVLRCGRCWRNLTTKWGKELHAVFSDGSMRCFAPEGRAAVDVDGVHVRVEYTGTWVVLDSPARSERLHEVVNVHG